jgi:putative chitinase
MSSINRQFFFARVRSNVFSGSLRQTQVTGMTFLLDTWERDYASKDDRWLAYALATVYHETAFTMLPIRERGGDAYFRRMYDINGERPAVARSLGNLTSGDGVCFHGRGYVQLTGRANYTKMQQHFGLDLTSSRAAADRVLEPAIAVKILFWGMEVGHFTGKKFGDYFNATLQDAFNARRIINRLDMAERIKGYWEEFYGAISYTTA